MNQKGFINIAIIVGIVVIAGIAGYFVFVQTPGEQTPDTEKEETGESTKSSQMDNNLSPQPPVSNVDTSNWQTFRSDIFGLEFKYPGEWRLGAGGGKQEANPKIQARITSPDARIENIYTGGDVPSNQIWRSGAVLGFDVWESAALSGEVSSELRNCLEVDGIEKNIELLFTKWPKCIEKGLLSGFSTKDAILITVSGQTAIRYETQVGKSNLNIVDIRLFNKKDDSLVSITFSSVEDEIDFNVPIFNAILSTIEFDS